MSAADDRAIGALADAAAAALGLRIPPEQRAGVVAVLAVILQEGEVAARGLAGAPAPVEVAPVYRA